MLTAPCKNPEPEVVQLSLLLVEDDEDDYYVIQKLLPEITDTRYEVKWVRSCSGAFKELARKSYDICLLCNLAKGQKGLDHIESFASIRPEMPIIFLSGPQDCELDRPAMEKGALGTLHKNEITPAIVRHCIRNAIAVKKAGRSLRDLEAKYHALFEDYSSVILFLDPTNGNVVDVNPHASRFYGYTREELLNKKITDLNILPEADVLSHLESARVEARRHFIFKHRLSDGRVKDVEVFSGPITLNNRQLIYSIIHDISERKLMESALVRREIELESKRRELEELNNGLRVILRMKEENEQALKEAILQNIKEAILPYLHKLGGTHLNEIQRTHLKIVEANLQEIAAPLIKELRVRSSNLSTMEMQVCMLVKDGRRNKEIAEILGISINTVLTHRYRVRTKLGLKNEKTNLRTFLNSPSFQ